MEYFDKCVITIKGLFATTVQINLLAKSDFDSNKIKWNKGKLGVTFVQTQHYKNTYRKN